MMYRLKLPSLPGFASLRGRYLYTTLGLCLILAAIAVIGRIVVQQVTRAHIAEIQQREEAAAVIDTALGNVHDFETRVQRFVIQPDDLNRATIEVAQSRLDIAILELLRTSWVKTTPAAEDLGHQLVTDSERLSKEVERLITIRLSEVEWFPAMQVMLERQLPDNMAFATAVNLAIEESRELRAEPAQQEIYELLVELRHIWSQMTSEFRLYVANRFGIFATDQQVAMAARTANVEEYGETAQILLDRFSTLDEKGQLGFQQSESLADMRRLHASWLEAHKDVVVVMQSEAWRADLPMLAKKIGPRFDNIRKYLTSLQSLQQAASSKGITEVAGTATRLSDFILLLVIGVALIITAGYLFIRVSILEPIAHVSRALKAEARGESGVLALNATASEINDLTEAFREMRYQVYTRQERLENILDNAGEAIIIFDQDGVIETFNNAAETLFGYRAGETTGAQVSMLMPQSGKEEEYNIFTHHRWHAWAEAGGAEREFEAKRKDGSLVPVAVKISETVMGGKHLFTALIADISERKAMIERLQYQAERDTLTGLPNRALFRDRLEHTLAQAKRNGTLVALLFLDLDKFKAINDTLGHQAGDQLLKAVAGRLGETLRASDTVARLGGDEFTAILEGVNRIDDVTYVAGKLHNLFSRPFEVNGQDISITTSIGISVYPLDAQDAENLIKDADTAMYHAKDLGRNSYQFYSKDMTERLARRLALVTELRRAIEQEEFVLHYQPIVDLESGRTISVEALLRWQHPERGLVFPDEFIPVLEDSGLIKAAGEWVLRTACAQCKAWQDSGRDTVPQRVMVNISARQLLDKNFVASLSRILEDADLDASHVGLEITEHTIMEDIEAGSMFLEALRSLGIHVAIDDFGTGHSSLERLKRFPIDTLKIDRSFVQDIISDVDNAAIVDAIIAMAHTLRLKVVAEGVETPEQLEQLRSYGCDAVQGYLYSRPVSPEEIG
jgi:diguanylate cyclase (GGDEF)-like protein/PAS domain S-box-containing protein